MDKKKIAEAVVRNIVFERSDRIAAAAVSDKDIEKLEQMTDQNDHTGALIYLFDKLLKDKKAANALKAIEQVAEYFGSIPRELSDLRHREFYEPAMERVKQSFDAETAKRIYMAF